MVVKAGKMFSRLSAIVCGVAVSLSLNAMEAQAVTMTDSGQSRVGFSFPLGPVGESSYDGPQFDAFKPFAGYTGTEILSLSSFTGQQQGSLLEVYMLSESAYFDGRDPNYANNFGVLDEAGNFISILDSAVADPGDYGSILQGAGDRFTFALQSPEALFSANDKDNADGAAHIVAQRVEQAGEVIIDNPSLRDPNPLRFQLLEGDMILFMEDMLATNNQGFLNIPGFGDFDYNDMVVVVRQTEIPEPTTLVLLGSALLGFGRVRRNIA